ncbi:hypothetical protein [Novosphingobium huizhouense]|uniref:hypothetical protein n=1 Tax=Novosphingobium huizhouense TaxID=2866625 RepID=UPI001CD86DFC|nr:hypothetical protein [Novosphingobium huizhouense]
MTDLDVDPFHLFLVAGLVMAALSVLSGWLDRQQNRRRNLDRVSLVNWRLLSTLSLLTAIVALSVAAKLWFTTP